MTDDNGWIEWTGGKCPVDALTPVELRLRGPSAWDSGAYANGRLASRFDWKHTGGRGDIMRYREVRS